ncbi:MAG TPA: hypothetical protein VFI31_28350 [Pirellulales bacterium]|nr:hypothetical protein [Pirellulales bacterium]
MEPSWKQADVFPIIVRLIGQSFSERHDYVTSRDLAERLARDSEAQSLIEVACRELDQQRSVEWLASNMVAWFGQRITVGESDWSRAVDRVKIEGNWAYRPADESAA